MNFQEAESYLLSLGNEVTAMKLGLDNIRHLLDELGSPQNAYLKVQVAGTNGKGSVCAFLNAICVSAHIRVGMYTSPHLLSICERIAIDGEPVSENEFAKAASLVRDTCERLVEGGRLASIPTFFEQVTAIALIVFANQHVQLAILETGLGGRLDATTAANAEIAAITRIDYDHQQYLGDTLSEITAEKAAIIRANSRVIVGPQQPEAMRVIDRVCSDHKSTPRYADRLPLPAVQLSLLGRHQHENAKIAVALAQELGSHFQITTDAIATGLSTARHPGRLEYYGQFLFDGAHNPGGATALGAFLKKNEQRPITVVFGCMRDKHVEAITRIIFPLGTSIVLTEPSSPRSLPMEELARIARVAAPEKRLIESTSVANAVDRALAVAGQDGIILVTGSLYLVGQVKQLLITRHSEA